MEADITLVPDPLLCKILLGVDFKTRMAALSVCTRWKFLPDKYPELLSDPCFTLTRPDSIVDQDMLEDMATWLLGRGGHATRLVLSSYPPALREEGKLPSSREQQLWVTVTACLQACAPSLRQLSLRWHEGLELSHHFLLLRGLTAFTAISDSDVMPAMLLRHTKLRELSLTAFTLAQGTPPDEYLPPNLTRLHLDVDPDKIPAQLTSLRQLSSLSLHHIDPHHFYRAELVESCSLLARLTQLRSLEISFSHLRELPPGLSALSRLTSLGLRSTTWRQGDLPAVLAPMTALRALDLSYHDMPSLPGPVEALGALQALGVAGNQFVALPGGPYAEQVEHLEVDCEWLGREGDSLAAFPRLRSMVVAGFGGPEGEAVLRRGLADVLAAAPRVAHLVLAAAVEGNSGAAGGRERAAAPPGGGRLSLPAVQAVTLFARARPQVELVLCMQGEQPTPAQALEGRGD